MCHRFVMEEATSEFEVAIGDSAVWVSPTDEFGSGGGVKGARQKWDKLSSKR
jgi:hypothetical protein